MRMTEGAVRLAKTPMIQPQLDYTIINSDVIARSSIETKILTYVGK